MNTKIFIAIIILIASMLACGGTGGSLDPSGNATISTDGNTAIYKYPENDSMDYCVVKNGVYYCKEK